MVIWLWGFIGDMEIRHEHGKRVTVRGSFPVVDSIAQGGR